MKPARVTVRAAITADGKLASADDPVVLRRLFRDDRVAEIHLTLLPSIDGRRRAATLTGALDEYFPASIRCRLVKMEVRGEECLLHYRVLRTRAKRTSSAPS